MGGHATVKKCVMCGSVLKQYKTLLKRYMRDGVPVMRCGVCGCKMCVRCGSAFRRREVASKSGTVRGLECVHCGYIYSGPEFR